MKNMRTIGMDERSLRVVIVRSASQVLAAIDDADSKTLFKRCGHGGCCNARAYDKKVIHAEAPGPLSSETSATIPAEKHWLKAIPKLFDGGLRFWHG